MFVKACAVGLTRKEGGAPRCLLQLVALARPPALMLEETEVGMKVSEAGPALPSVGWRLRGLGVVGVCRAGCG